jgi:excisionase family DNA binding protein
MYVQFTTEVYKAMPKPPEAEPLLTVEDAARLTQTSTKWIRNQIRLGKLRIIRFGRAIRITREDLEAFIKSHRD